MASSSSRPILQPSSRSRGSNRGHQQQQHQQGGPSTSRGFQGPQTAQMTHEERQRIARAGMILESNEMLVRYSVENCESLPQTRLHFERELIGLSSSSDESIEWEEQFDIDEEDERRMRPGTVFTKDGWYHPDDQKHGDTRYNDVRGTGHSDARGAGFGSPSGHAGGAGSKRNSGFSGAVSAERERERREGTPEGAKKRKSLGKGSGGRRSGGGGGRRGAGGGSSSGY